MKTTLGKINTHFKGLITVLVLFISRKLLYKLQYLHQRGKFPDLKNPRDLSERLLSNMLHPAFAIKYADYADKIKVRQYVKSKGLEDILLRHYGVWQDANKIDFGKLPEKFALKTNNGCGGHIFCRNKAMFDIRKAVIKLNKARDLPYIFNKEPHYKAIKPLIYCEELLDTGSEDLPVDYKFICIKGNPVYIVVYTERNIQKKICMFDMGWNFHDLIIKSQVPEKIPEKPENLEKMIDIARKLSEGFDFVRVDLYNHESKIFFGELTFTPSGGLFRSFNDEAIRILGKLFEQPD